MSYYEHSVRFTEEQVRAVFSCREFDPIKFQIIPIIDRYDHVYGLYWLNLLIFGPNYFEPNMSHQIVNYSLELREFNSSAKEFVFLNMGWPQYCTMKYHNWLVKFPEYPVKLLLSIYARQSNEFRLKYHDIFGLQGLTLEEISYVLKSH
jgi:hypothetical protein